MKYIPLEPNVVSTGLLGIRELIPIVETVLYVTVFVVFIVVALQIAVHALHLKYATTNEEVKYFKHRMKLDFLGFASILFFILIIIGVNGMLLTQKIIL